MSRQLTRLKERAASTGAHSARWQFLRGFFKNPKMVASVVPSSQRLIDRMLAPVDWEHCDLFVEYGPGVGTFTREILTRLRPDAMLVAIDPNPDFISFLSRDIRDPRFKPVEGSAADVEQIVRDHGFAFADYVVSGLPFTTLPDGVGDEIGAATGRVVRHGGAFLVYQFSPKVLDYIKPHFERIDRGFEWANVPPATLFWAYRERS